MTETVDRNGRKRRFTYDGLNRQTEERWLDGAGATVRTIAFAFDAASQMTSASDSDSAYAYTYDGLGQVTRVDNTATPNVPDVLLDSKYDALGNRTELSATVNTVNDFLATWSYHPAQSSRTIYHLAT